MKTKEYVYQINEHELLLRNARKEDAELLIEGLKQVCGETPFLAKEKEEITFTIEQEENFITQINEANNNIMLLGFLDGEYVGNCSLTGKLSSRFKHRASLGIALLEKFTSMGIGKKMLETLFEISKDMQLEQIELEVVTTNERAIHLYKKLGFEIYGTHPHDMKYKDGTYADVYFMVKFL